PGGPGGRTARGVSGTITAGLAALERAVGGRVNDDFATSGHARNSFHYRGEAADLAVDAGVWAKLYANRGMFAELFGPWGLYHFGVQFYDAALQKEHMNHIHVAYTGGPQAISRMVGGTTTTPKSIADLVSQGTTTHHKPKAPVWHGLRQAGLTTITGSIDASIAAARKATGSVLESVE